MRPLFAFALCLQLIARSVTGTSSGVGRAVAEVALEKGEIVVATARRLSSLDDLAERYTQERLLVLSLDVTQQDQVVLAFAEAKRAFGRVDVVFNNAGFGHVGELEATEEATARSVFEANFWGAASVAKEAVKCFRETNPPGAGGRLLQMSSYVGLAGVPGSAFYGASKFGASCVRRRATMRSLNLVLPPCSAGGCIRIARRRARSRMEYQGLTSVLFFSDSVLKLTISSSNQVTIIEPGWIRTKLFDNVTWSPEHPAYQNPNLPVTYIRRFGWDKATVFKDARRTAEAFYSVASIPNPPLHFVVGKDAIEVTRKKLAALAADIAAYEALSEGLDEEEFVNI